MITKEQLIKIVFIACLITGIFSVIGNYINETDVTALPVWLMPHWNYIKQFFALGPVAFMIALGYNLYGYLRNYYRSNKKEIYIDNKFYETLLFFGGFIITIGTLLPEPFNVFGMMLVIAGKYILSEVKKMQEGFPEESAPVPTPTSTT